MTQVEIAGLAVLAFGLFMFGYSLGWMHRAARLGCVVLEVASQEAIDGMRADLEAAVRRSQR
ncbi:hypothetical protein [Bradyrhizobium lablabi]|uniref:hypothetical protein n=1 Tax=Bradyrhizobium lablabi TaxID=722472 RepID=UPI001BAABEA9|nr:hypothetical protein [Bradyrhizobium lablabi]MBR0695969.1 hypothetical protein [Bradyrhizobium lablabi]